MGAGVGDRRCRAKIDYIFCQSAELRVHALQAFHFCREVYFFCEGRSIGVGGSLWGQELAIEDVVQKLVVFSAKVPSYAFMRCKHSIFAEGYVFSVREEDRGIRKEC